MPDTVLGNIDAYVRWDTVKYGGSLVLISLQRRADFIPVIVRDWLNARLPHGFSISPAEFEPGRKGYVLIPPQGMPFELALDREVQLTITVTSRIAEPLTERPGK